MLRFLLLLSHVLADVPVIPRMSEDAGQMLLLPSIALNVSQHLKRDFVCPNDTVACSNVGEEVNCCPKDQTCRRISDSVVGCCPNGQDCVAAVADCPLGHFACSSDVGGGCCLNGFSCVAKGCIVNSATTVIVSPSSEQSPGTTAFQVVSQTETVTAAPPVRPTSITQSQAPTSITQQALPSASLTVCPTGFFACSAEYAGGCCRLGRDCSSTSCPPVSNTVAVDTNGIRINVAEPSNTALGQDSCALGWYKCPGSGCCPSGYTCGQSCTATAVNLGNGVTGTAQVAKNNRAGVVTCSTVPVWVLVMLCFQHHYVNWI